MVGRIERVCPNAALSKARETSTTSSPSIFTTSSSTIQRRIPYVSSKYIALRSTLPDPSQHFRRQHMRICESHEFVGLGTFQPTAVWKVDNGLCELPIACSRLFRDHDLTFMKKLILPSWQIEDSLQHKVEERSLR